MLSRQKHLSRVLWNTLKKTKGVKTTFNSLGTLKVYPKETLYFCVVVSSKHEKKAVKRNRLKRRLSSLFKEKSTVSKDIFIVFPSKKAYDLSYEETKELFSDLFSKNTQ